MPVFFCSLHAPHYFTGKSGQDHLSAKEDSGCPCSAEHHVDAVPMYVVENKSWKKNF